MSMLARVPAALALLAVTACSGDGAPKPIQPVASLDASPVRPPVAPGGTITVTTHRRGGTPHHAAINAIALDARGTVALTRDLLGEWRVWPALDGKLPSQRVPIESALTGTIAPLAAGGFVIGAIDGADGLEIVKLGADGTTIK